MLLWNLALQFLEDEACTKLARLNVHWQDRNSKQSTKRTKAVDEWLAVMSVSYNLCVQYLWCFRHLNTFKISLFRLPGSPTEKETEDSIESFASHVSGQRNTTNLLAIFWSVLRTNATNLITVFPNHMSVFKCCCNCRPWNVLPMIAFLAGQVRSEIYQSFSDMAGKAVQAAADTHHSVWRKNSRADTHHSVWRKNSRRYGCVRNAVFVRLSNVIPWGSCEGFFWVFIFFHVFCQSRTLHKMSQTKKKQFLRILVESLKMIHFWKGLLWDLFGAFSSQAFPRFQNPGYGKRLACRGLEVLRWVERRTDHTFSDSQSQKFCYSRFLMHVMVKLELLAFCFLATKATDFIILENLERLKSPKLRRNHGRLV